MSLRKEFYLNDNINLPIRACGVILYKIEKDDVYLLLIQKNGEYEDLGGRAENTDEAVYDVVAREAYEESNKLLDKDSIKKRLPLSNFSYNLHAKYITYFVEANENESKLVTDDFGDKEIHDDILRQIKWVNIKTVLNPSVIQYKLAKRLKNKEFFDIAKNIKKNLAEWESF